MLAVFRNCACHKKISTPPQKKKGLSWYYFNTYICAKILYKIFGKGKDKLYKNRSVTFLKLFRKDFSLQKYYTYFFLLLFELLNSTKFVKKVVLK